MATISYGVFPSIRRDSNSCASFQQRECARFSTETHRSSSSVGYEEDEEIDLVEKRRIGDLVVEEYLQLDKVELQRLRCGSCYDSKEALSGVNIAEEQAPTPNANLLTIPSDQRMKSLPTVSQDETTSRHLRPDPGDLREMAFIDAEAIVEPDMTTSSQEDVRQEEEQPSLQFTEENKVQQQEQQLMNQWSDTVPSTAETRETEVSRETSLHDEAGVLSVGPDIEEETRQIHAVYRAFGGVPTEYIEVDAANPIQPESRYHVVVKILASTITLQDCLLRRGLDFQVVDPVSLPVIPGQDFVGLVVKCGEAANTFEIGDLVAGMVRTGGNARFISVAENMLVDVPPECDPADAVCMVSVYATAYLCLKLVAENNLMFAMNGKKVLIVGGIDGVGEALVQLCKKAKAEIYFTAPERRYIYVRKMLDVIPVPEDPEQWSFLGDHCMDLVFDGVCQNGMSASFKALKDTGKLVCFGREFLLRQKMGIFGAPISAYFEKLIYTPISAYFEKMVYTNFYGRVKFLDLWDLHQNNLDVYKKNLQAIYQLLRWNKVKPHIARKVSLDEVGLSHHKLESGEVRGTVVCMPWKRVSKKHFVKILDEFD